MTRRRHYFVSTRTTFKNKIHAELSRRWIDYSKTDPFTLIGIDHLKSLHIAAVNDYLDAIEFLDAKIKELDSEIKEQALQDKYAKLLVTIPGISYGALLISSEIADINRFPDPEHLSLVRKTHSWHSSIWRHTISESGPQRKSYAQLDNDSVRPRPRPKLRFIHNETLQENRGDKRIQVAISQLHENS